MMRASLIVLAGEGRGSPCVPLSPRCNSRMIIPLLDAARIVVPIAVFMAILGIGNALGLRFGVEDYSLSWHAYVAAVYWVGFCIFPVASWIVTKSFYEMALAAGSMRWPIVRGKIIASEVEETIGLNGTTFFRPKVRYQYTIVGRDYENDAVQTGRTNFFTDDSAAKIVARYPVGTYVDLRCNPADASEAVLETGTDNARRNILIGLILLAVPFVAGAAIVWHNSN
jgi:hypothetical protein